jgi:hypothetical protein
MRFNTGALIVMLVLSGAICASAQETTGTITGRAADAQGLPVPGVTVTATGPQGIKTAITDSQGHFAFPFIPGISSLYDFPQNDPTYTSIGAPQFGFQGDIQFLGNPDGILPLDRPNQFKVVGNYTVHDLNLGVGLNAGSGAPLTPLTTNPVYGNGGEIPAALRGSGIQTVDGLMTRTPFQSDVDFQAAYQFRLGGARRLTVLADIFNLFNQQIVLGYDTFTSLTFGAGANPNFGQPTSQILAGPQIQAPRQIRLGARFVF